MSCLILIPTALPNFYGKKTWRAANILDGSNVGVAGMSMIHWFVKEGTFGWQKGNPDK